MTNVPEDRTDARRERGVVDPMFLGRRRLGLSQQRVEFFVRRLLAQEPGALFELRGLRVGLGRVADRLR